MTIATAGVRARPAIRFLVATTAILAEFSPPIAMAALLGAGHWPL